MVLKWVHKGTTGKEKKTYLGQGLMEVKNQHVWTVVGSVLHTTGVMSTKAPEQECAWKEILRTSSWLEWDERSREPIIWD